MSIKSLFFFLFLYVCLVWVGAALLKEGPEIRAFGLLWTAIGLIAVISWIIISWAWGWFRVAKARSAAKPKSTPKAAPVVTLHEEDAALLALIQEAKVTLVRSAKTTTQSTRFSDLPLYLLVGPEGAGKTSTFLNSTLETVSLSGQPGSLAQPNPTRLGNIWLANNSLFVELGGRAFSGDLARWASLLRTLRGGSSVSRWQRFLKEPDPGLSPRGIIAFGDVKEFMGATSPQGRDKLERLSSLWSDRLGAVTEVFGRQFPVYWITTKTDSVPYFGDYFARLRGPELNQIFGCTLPAAPATGASPEAAGAQAEIKRLTKATSPLLHRLAERRLLHLSREEDPRRKPGVYEFPREMRRIRPTIVQFLTNVFRPHPLRHTPLLRGFYFTGKCEDTSTTNSPRPSSEDSSVILDDASVFNGDASQVFRAPDPTNAPKPVSRAGLPSRWAFVSDLFTSVVLRDNITPQTVTAAVDPQLDLYRKMACGAACFISLLLCLCFLRSWVGNSRLLDSVNKVADGRATPSPSLADLDDLDKLHGKVLQLLDFDRNGAPWRFRWGLYTGNALVEPARQIYFRRFDAMLLRGLNESMVAKLRSVPAAASAEDTNYRLISDDLKTHLMISSNACKAEPPFVSRVLKQTLVETNPTAQDDWTQLANRQIDFYASELPSGNPVKVAQDFDAVERARQYLQSVKGADRLYAALLVTAQKRFPTTQSLTTLAPDYAKVMTGSPDVSGVFTPEGWNFIQKTSKDVRANISDDPCTGSSKNIVGEHVQDAALEREIQDLFVRDYIAAWLKFVSSFSVQHYNGPADAARRLSILADHRSPLLAVFALASKNTYFPPSQPNLIDKSIAQGNSMMEKLKGKLGVNKDSDVPDARQTDPATEIQRSFQPVQSVVPGQTDTWVVDKNKAYVESLAQLATSMDAIAQSPTHPPDPALLQQATQNRDKALDAARLLAEQLSNESNGLDTTVQRLLREPILAAQGSIPSVIDPRIKVIKETVSFCQSISPILHKFPFQAAGPDARLEDFVSLFAPGSGKVWKYQLDSLADSVVKDGAHWKAKDGAKVPASADMLDFLNRAQDVTNAFFANGPTQPQLQYTLRPKLDPAYQNVFIEFDVDGQTHQWKNSLQQQFIWPAAPGTTGGAVGRIVTPDGLSLSFSSYGGVWAIFHMMSEAEPRLLKSNIVEWKYSRGSAGVPQPITPAPVRFEFVDFPSGIDVFNPKFLNGLQCPVKAVQ